MIYRRIVNGAAEERAADPNSFHKHYDVIVAGVGTAGAYAVISAARNGAKVLGVDRLSAVGGMGTVGYVSGYYYGLGGGLHIGVDQAAEALKDESFLDTVEPKKYLLENIIAEHKADLLLESVVTGVFMEGKQIKGISVISQGSLMNFSCEMLIDATADAAVCVMAGCNTGWGRESDGKTRPFTSVKVSLNSNGDLTRTNHDSGYVNQYDPFELSKGIMQAHKSQLLEEFTNKDQRVLFFAPFIGIREGRLIEAEKTIWMQDVIECKQEEEPLFYGYSDFDKHGKDHALETEDLQDWYVVSNLSTACLSVPVTIHNLIPKGYQSIIAAGRHIGVDHDTASILRMKRDMQKCGESAGACAALAVHKGVQPAEVPYEELKKILEETGCLTEDHNVGIWFDDKFRREKIVWMNSPEQIKAELATDMPGIAIYSCKRLGENIRPYLLKWMKDKDDMLRYNSAIALGLIGDKAGLDLLREIVVNRDSFYYKDCRRTNQLRTAIAIYLLGRLGDQQSIPILREILCNPEEYKKPLYHEITELSYKFNENKNFNEVYFQVISQAATSMIRIMERHPERKEEIAQIIKKAFQDDRHINNTTTLPPKTFEYESMENVKTYVLSRIQ
jgi:hypothetical protein